MSIGSASITRSKTATAGAIFWQAIEAFVIRVRTTPLDRPGNVALARTNWSSSARPTKLCHHRECSEKPKIVDTEGLSDADLSEINKLLRVYDAGGSDAFWEAVEELGDEDPVRYVAVAGAFFPDVVRKIIRDEMAEQDMTEEDVRDLFKKLKMGGGPDTGH